MRLREYPITDTALAHAVRMLRANNDAMPQVLSASNRNQQIVQQCTQASIKPKLIFNKIKIIRSLKRCSQNTPTTAIREPSHDSPPVRHYLDVSASELSSPKYFLRRGTNKYLQTTPVQLFSGQVDFCGCRYVVRVGLPGLQPSNSIYYDRTLDRRKPGHASAEVG